MTLVATSKVCVGPGVNMDCTRSVMNADIAVNGSERSGNTRVFDAVCRRYKL